MANYLNYSSLSSLTIEKVYINATSQSIQMQLSQLPPYSDYDIMTGYVATALNITTQRIAPNFMYLGMIFLFFLASDF
jgi:hypothetical protein